MSFNADLLIVPYGIETRYKRKKTVYGNYLLIVPYGIETSVGPIRYGLPSLLIVPYGIETAFSGQTGRYPDRLLIVPYGIETLPFGIFVMLTGLLTHIAQLLPSNSLKFNHPIFQEALSGALQILT